MHMKMPGINRGLKDFDSEVTVIILDRGRVL